MKESLIWSDASQMLAVWRWRAPRGSTTGDFIKKSFVILDWRDNETDSCTFKDSRHITATIEGQWKSKNSS